jgi:hypothetical protein
VTALVVVAVCVLGMLDGVFAGFRASLGRTGLVRHGAHDLVAARRGVVLVAVLLAPVVVLGTADVLLRPGRVAVYRDAGVGMLAVYAPYAALVLLALAGYLTLGWRSRFLASALLLGPLTLVRPAVVLAGVVVAAVGTRDGVATALVLGAAAAVLAVEPVAGRRWYARGPADASALTTTRAAASPSSGPTRGARAPGE